MKKVLILVVSSQGRPYDKMADTQSATWDSIHVDGVDTVFYFGGPVKHNTDSRIYFDIDEAYSTMGQKMLMAFKWALQYKDFDYIARVNSSCYVDKKQLLQHVQTLPDSIFSGLIVKPGEHDKRGYPWIWGPAFILSKDVVQKIADNPNLWDHGMMEDLALSDVANKLSIPLVDGMAASIDRDKDKWRCINYGSESYEFTDFSEIKKGQHFWRVKQDYDRIRDKYVMEQLFKYLQ